MPKKPINYDNTHFYKLCCKDPIITDIYIGHTTDFIRRKHNHKTSCCNEKDKEHNSYKYQFVRDNGSWNNWDMVLLETLKCDDALHARKTERGFIEKLGPTLNKSIPSRTLTEYNDTNRERINKRQKEYDQSHKDHRKQYHELNKDRINKRQKQYDQSHKDHKKQYRELKKEKINEQKKQQCYNINDKLDITIDEDN